jgi:hypothetical protein
MSEPEETTSFAEDERRRMVELSSMLKELSSLVTHAPAVGSEIWLQEQSLLKVRDSRYDDYMEQHKKHKKQAAVDAKK